MTILECVDLRTLLQLEADLSPQSIEGFLGFVRGSYGLAHLAYICPSLGWGRVRDPALALAYSDAWLEHFQLLAQERCGGSEPLGSAVAADLPASMLKSFAEGNRPHEIAMAMLSSPEVVKAYLESARHKLQALNTAPAVAKAFRAGLIE